MLLLSSYKPLISFTVFIPSKPLPPSATACSALQMERLMTSVKLFFPTCTAQHFSYPHLPPTPCPSISLPPIYSQKSLQLSWKVLGILLQVANLRRALFSPHWFGGLSDCLLCWCVVVMLVWEHCKYNFTWMGLVDGVFILACRSTSAGRRKIWIWHLILI